MPCALYSLSLIPETLLLSHLLHTIYSSVYHPSIPRSLLLPSLLPSLSPEISFTPPGPGPEIWAQTAGKVDGFICAIGTGGTLAGTGKVSRQCGDAAKAGGIMRLLCLLSLISCALWLETHCIQLTSKRACRAAWPYPWCVLLVSGRGRGLSDVLYHS